MDNPYAMQQMQQMGNANMMANPNMMGMAGMMGMGGGMMGMPALNFVADPRRFTYAGD